MKNELLNNTGIASIVDFNSDSWKKIYSEMEEYQKEFLSKENKFRSSDYIWPSDALHNWSRIWEYPYVFFHLERLLKENEGANNVLDVGSGVTFFTTFLAKYGFNITATDIDPIAEKDLNKAIELFQSEKGKANFKLCTDENLPFEDSQFDIVTSISVIEHVSDFEKNISEISRVLKPNGTFILTFDIDLDGRHELRPESYSAFIDVLNNYFIKEIPNRTIHPKSMLTNKNSSFPDYYYKQDFKSTMKRITNKVKSTLGIHFYHPGYLTCQGEVLRKI